MTRSSHGHCRGGRRTREYHSWQSMIARCCRPSHPYYELYGGRGITICQRWRNSFAAFLEDMGPRPAGMTLDRIDPDGNYDKENCRWATVKTQNFNRRPSEY